MNPTSLVVGVVLLLVAVVDILWTTLWVEGRAGPLTSCLMSSTWKILKKESTSANRERLGRICRGEPADSAGT